MVKTQTITGKTPQYLKPSDILAEISSPELQIPKDLVLHQNYPNPFNPETRIAFDLSTAANVKIDVFNLLGQFVTTIVDRFVTSGSHSIPFDASQLPSGVYLYRLSAKNFVEVKKMMYQK